MAVVGVVVEVVVCDYHLVFADRRATARTTTFVEPCSIQINKKKLLRWLFGWMWLFVVVGVVLVVAVGIAA